MLNTQNSGRFLWTKWHVFRETARQNEVTADVFSDSEKEQFDLTEEFAENTDPAKITGEDAVETFVEYPYGADTDRYDVRETNPRRM